MCKLLNAWLLPVSHHGNGLKVSGVECSLRCRYTMRGHTESVNAVEFLPYSNILITCSADKTVSIWDARTVSCLFRTVSSLDEK